jgi:hypothetical protein
MLERFDADRRGLDEVARSLARIADEIGERGLRETALGEAEKLQGERFHLAVAGEFKRGKSTLVNALLGVDLLPMGVVPLTSIVTEIGFGEGYGARVFFTDGHSQEIRLEALSEFVTETGNPGNRKGVRRVCLSAPARLLARGVRLFDTPGVGSAIHDNTATTESFLPEIDAAIFLFGADQPASRSEIEFLGRIRRHAGAIFLVLNKIDLLAPGERREALEFVASTLQRVLGDGQAKIYPISARCALEARRSGREELLKECGLAELERDLERFLLERRGTVLLEGGRRRLASVANRLRDLCRLSIRLAEMPVETLSERIEAFESLCERIRWDEAATLRLLENEVDTLNREVSERLLAFAQGRRSLVEERLREAAALGRRSGKKALVRALVSTLDGVVKELFESAKKEAEREIAAAFQRIVSGFAERANSLAAEVRRAVRELFEVDLDVSFAVPPMAARSRHFTRVDNPFGAALDDLVLAVLPGPVARRLILRRFLAGVAHELERNATLLAVDLADRVRESVASFRRNFRAEVEELLAELRRCLSRAETQRKEDARRAGSARAEVEPRLRLLEELSARLESAGEALP